MKQLFWIAIAICMTGRIYGQPRLDLAPLSDSLAGISVLTPSSPKFLSAVNSLISPADFSKFESILPYSIIVQNQTSRPLAGLCVRFEITEPNGRARKMDQALGGVPPEPRPVLDAGKTMLVAVEGSFTYSGVHPRINPTMQLPVDFYNSAKAISVLIDSVMFSDGTFAGPDTIGMFRRYSAHLSADLALTQTVLNYKGKDAAALGEYLETNAVLDRSDPEITDRTDPYLHEMAQLSRAYGKALSRRGADYLFEDAAHFHDYAAAFTLHR